MSMYELTQILWRRRRLIAIVAVIIVVAGTAAVLAGGTRRTYTAKSQVIVEQPVLLGALDGVNVPNKLNAFLPTLCSILDGDSAATQVASQAGEPVGTA